MKPLKASDIKSEYVPSEEDQKRIVKKPNCFKLSGDGVFHTIQGEGATLGQPATFVRLHFCNLRCSWCDTWYTWHRGTKEFFSEPFDVEVGSLQKKIREAQSLKGVKKKDHVYKVVFTGGEPLLQQKEIALFLDENPEYSCEIETNGTILPCDDLERVCAKGRVRFNCSPKLKSSCNGVSLAQNRNVLLALSKYPTTLFKFVCKSKDDIKEVLEKFEYLPKGQIAIMPEGVTKEENTASYENIIDVIIEHGLVTYPRLQNICFDGAKRGV